MNDENKYHHLHVSCSRSKVGKQQRNEAQYVEDFDILRNKNETGAPADG